MKTMNETIISDSKIWEYALMLLLLSPIVFITLYLLTKYPNPTRYKKPKRKDEKCLTLRP